MIVNTRTGAVTLTKTELRWIDEVRLIAVAISPHDKTNGARDVFDAVKTFSERFDGNGNFASGMEKAAPDGKAK